MTKVAILMGSDSDEEIMKGSWEALEEFGVDYEVRVLSAHRTPDAAIKFAKDARKNGISVIIAGAGGAAHLPGVLAANTTVPVIGVPISSGILDGLDALLSIAQMPRGIPVATVAVDNSRNAGLLALRILSLFNEKIHNQYEQMVSNFKEQVLKKDKSMKAKHSKGA